MILTHPASPRTSASSHPVTGPNNSTKNGARDEGKGQPNTPEQGGFEALTQANPAVAEGAAAVGTQADDSLAKHPLPSSLHVFEATLAGEDPSVNPVSETPSDPETGEPPVDTAGKRSAYTQIVPASIDSGLVMSAKAPRTDRPVDAEAPTVAGRHGSPRPMVSRGPMAIAGHRVSGLSVGEGTGEAPASAPASGPQPGATESVDGNPVSNPVAVGAVPAHPPATANAKAAMTAATDGVSPHPSSSAPILGTAFLAPKPPLQADPPRAPGPGTSETATTRRMTTAGRPLVSHPGAVSFDGGRAIDLGARPGIGLSGGDQSGVMVSAPDITSMSLSGPDKTVSVRPGASDGAYSSPATQLAETMEARTISHGTRFVLELVPATLGRVSVSVLFKNGEMRVNIRSDRSDTLTMLQSDGRVLERSLEAHAPRGGQTILDFELDQNGRGGGRNAPQAHTDERANRPGEPSPGDDHERPPAPTERAKRVMIEDEVSTIDVRM